MMHESTESGSHEFDYIHWVRSRAHNASSRVAVGIGDDAAVQDLPTARQMLIAKDVLMEGTHFTFPEATPQLAGRKALAVNLSDIAAMGGEPVSAYIGLVLPRQRGPRFARDVHSGIQALADDFNLVIAGGDTNIWDGPLVISVTVLGEVDAGQAILRSGAQVGDAVYVTGPLGGSFPSHRHLTFTPRLEAARMLKRAANIHSMIDISDGLGRDLGHLLEESRMGVVLDSQRIPIHTDVDPTLDPAARLQHAMSDGEDFELLFTVSPDDSLHLQSRHFPFPLTRIGTITAGPERLLQAPDGTQSPLLLLGYEHGY